MKDWKQPEMETIGIDETAAVASKYADPSCNPTPDPAMWGATYFCNNKHLKCCQQDKIKSGQGFVIATYCKLGKKEPDVYP